MYRSRANRAIHKGDFDTAISISATGACVLASCKYDSAALELATHLTDLLETKSIPLSPMIRNSLTNIDDAFEPGSKARGTFLKGCIKWDRMLGVRALGDPLLHARLAFHLWENEDTRGQSTHHFALAEAPDRLAAKLENVKDELIRDRLLLMGILHFLSVENMRDANELLKMYMKQRRASKKTYEQSKLVRFCDQLMRLVARDAAPLFQKLCTVNSMDLSFSETVPGLIKGPIASIYFGIAPERAINPMLQALLGGLN